METTEVVVLFCGSIIMLIVSMVLLIHSEHRIEKAIALIQREEKSKPDKEMVKPIGENMRLIDADRFIYNFNARYSGLKVPCEQVIRELKLAPVAADQKEEKAGWISVTEAMPEDLEEVIVTWVNHNPESYYAHVKDKPFVGFAVRYRDAWYWWTDTTADFLAEYGWMSNTAKDFAIDGDIEITAWMRRPGPYKEEE